VNDRDAARLVENFEHLRLPKPQWTHEAHLVVCRATLERRGPAGALAHLRRAIRAYNESTGVAHTDTGGYHETLTAFYVGAVDAVGGVDGIGSAGPLSLDELVAHPACSRTAPLRHWSRARLFSVEARRAWLEPDLEPLAWWSPDAVEPAAG
jgi:hypothetical protein